MAALRLEYAQRLEGDLRRASEAVRALVASPLDKALKERARFEVHRLKGSAGTFGFDGVSARAAELEELVLATGREPATIPPEQWAEATRNALEALLASR